MGFQIYIFLFIAGLFLAIFAGKKKITWLMIIGIIISSFGAFVTIGLTLSLIIYISTLYP